MEHVNVPDANEAIVYVSHTYEVRDINPVFKQGIIQDVSTAHSIVLSLVVILTYISLVFKHVEEPRLERDTIISIPVFNKLELRKGFCNEELNQVFFFNRRVRSLEHEPL